MANQLWSTLPKTNLAPGKMVVGRLCSTWKGLFSGAFAVSFTEGTVSGAPTWHFCSHVQQSNYPVWVVMFV